ncbi:hypothetical protein BGZ72_001130 [Mortierella alpina]|nr:hypothetical protein BGZ72_001130 [Mortierella alpina]
MSYYSPWSIDCGLIYYGYTLIKDVAEREVILQSTAIKIRLDDQRSQTAGFPELIVCTNGTIAGGEYGTLIIPKETHVLAPGIWGLFGNFANEPLYTVTTTADKYSTGKEYSDVWMLSPTRSDVERQILIVSIPEALGDWGGTFGSIRDIHSPLHSPKNSEISHRGAQ